MTDYAYHTVTPVETGRHDRFRVDVFRGGELVDVDPDTGEATFEGGTLVATLYRRTLNFAHEAGITYSLIAAGKGGVQAPKRAGR